MFAVVGGGAAGSAAAFVLKRAGHGVVLFEASDSLGGRTRTVQRDGFGVEVGAIYMLNSYAKCIELLNDSGARNLLEPWSPLAGLWDGRSLHPVQYDYMPSFFKMPMLTLRDKVRLTVRAAQSIVSRAPEPFETDSLAQFDKGENMEVWARRRLGDPLFECLVRPLIEPSFGTDCRELSVPYLQGVMKRAHRAKFFLPWEGMGSVCSALTRGIDVRLGAEVTGIESGRDGVKIVTADASALHVEGVVVATDARRAAQLLETVLEPATVQALNSAPYASMAHVNLRWRRNPWPGNKFEMILPIGTGPRQLLGTIVKSSASSRLVPPGACMTNSYFSSRATQDLTNDELIDTALRHVAETLGKDFPEPEAEVFTSDRALAICPPGHYHAMKQLRDTVPARVAIAGDYLAHLGVETAVVSGDRAARRLLSG
ncbi:FAD-dependent oxidoreductase [Mycobacteriaceae bacterium Msp059]|nr:FAD-dependent oxidoreductase [Mycobacteriaceae bacterium Msp059]